MQLYYVYKSKRSFDIKGINIPFILMIFLIVTLFSGCKDDEIGKNLLGDLKDQNPFTGHETLMFLNNNGDSIVFYCDGRQSEIFHYTPNYNNDKYYVNEWDMCCFLNENGKFELRIYMSSHLGSGAQMDFSFTESILPDGGGYNAHTIQFGLPLLPHLVDTRFYIDSLKVIDKYFYNIIVDSSLLYDSFYYKRDDVVNFATAIFYTTTHGIVKVDFEDGDSWGLKEVIW